MCEALQRLSIARIQVARKLPYYHRIAYGLRPVVQEGLGTVGVTAEQVLLYDPKQVLAWREADLPGIMLHEILHLALRHPQRIEVLRQADGVTFDHYRANLACDFEVNRIVRALKLSLPDGAAFAEAHKLPANVLAEEAYRLLAKQDEDGDDQGDDGGSNDGEQDGEPGKQGKQGKVLAGRCGSCAGNPVDGEDDVPAEAKAGKLEQQAMQREVAQAILQADKNAPGSVPGEILREAKQVLEPAQVRWQDVLARHVRRAVTRKAGVKDYTFARSKRRQAMFAGANDPLLPSMFDPVVSVGVVVDTSGSMSKAELELALREIDGILHATRTSMRVVTCDREVQKDRKVTRAVEAADMLRGGGGTDFRPAFQHMEQYRPGVTVVITDGYGPAPDQAPRWTDTVWLLVGKDTTKPWDRNGGQIAWGEFIKAT
jgi:hypothetical protein